MILGFLPLFACVVAMVVLNILLWVPSKKERKDKWKARYKYAAPTDKIIMLMKLPKNSREVWDKFDIPFSIYNPILERIENLKPAELRNWRSMIRMSSFRRRQRIIASILIMERFLIFGPDFRGLKYADILRMHVDGKMDRALIPNVLQNKIDYDLLDSMVSGRI